MRPAVLPLLTDAAFGAHPDRAPLPRAHTVEGLWLRGVVLGGQGRYAQARAELTTLLRATSPTTSDPHHAALRSLAMSTWASFLRQGGRHQEAASFDGAALAALPMSSADAHADAAVAAARADAWTGLAADNLGMGRLGVGWELQRRCEALVASFPDEQLQRQRIRWSWVSAELSLAAGNFVDAGTYADRAAALALEWGSVRHHVKSTLLQCAVMTGTEPLETVLECGEQVRARCERLGLVPLEWAASLLLAGVSSQTRGVQSRDRCEELLRRRGGYFRC
ncbi:MAG: hypothetical protein GX542_05155 [Rhodococcus sp.]|nr:hypothetical protein [Rhodococcus sp. (in: high G+C Gram-positive bacteria)]